MLESHLNLMKPKERKRLGAVYTPPEVVRYILDAVGYRAERDIENKFLIDPACGSGNFLIEAVNRLLVRLRRIGLDTNDPSGARGALEIISSHIYGVDIDPKACQLALSALNYRLRSFYKEIDEAREKVGVSYNIKCLDALALINRSYNRALLNDVSFDYVVGNPPYIRLDNIPQKKREIYKKSYRSATGRFDISVLFLELGIDLLRQGGKFGYITTNRFMLTDYGKKIRALVLEKTNIKQIIDFNGSGVFKEVTNYPCIIILEKSEKRGVFKVVNVYRQESLSSISEKLCLQNFHGQNMEIFQLNQESLTEDPWLLIPEEAKQVFEKIRTAGPPLERVTSRIGVGTASGLDRVFVVTEEDSSTLEKELLKPAVKGEDVRRWEIQWQGLYLIIPYINKKEGIERVDISRYPQTESYLKEHKEALEKRYCVKKGKEWFELHDSVDASMGERQKIITPDISDRNNFALDKGRYHCLHTCYYIYPEIDSKYLLGLLNSKVLEFYFKLISPRLSGGYYRYVTQYLAKLPIVEADSSPFKDIIRAVDQKDEERIDSKVSQVYNISVVERDIIERCLTRWRA